MCQIKSSEVGLMSRWVPFSRRFELSGVPALTLLLREIILSRITQGYLLLRNGKK